MDLPVLALDVVELSHATSEVMESCCLERIWTTIRCQEPDAPDFALLSGEGREWRRDNARAMCKKNFKAIVHATPGLGAQYGLIFEREQFNEFSEASRCGVSINRKTNLTVNDEI